MPLSPSVSVLRFVAATLCLGVLLVSCSGPGRTAKPPGLPNRFPNHSPEQIRAQLLEGADTLQSYTAKARVTVQSPRQNRSFNAVVRHRRADSLYMRFSLFGIEGGRLLLTRDSVFFYDTRKAVLRVGPVEAVQRIFPAPVSSSNFFQNMLGLIAPAPRTNWSLQSDSTLYYVSSPRDRQQYTVDPMRWRVLRFKERTQNGTVVQDQSFSNFRPVDGLVLPSRVVFRRPAADLRAEVRYQTMDLNPSNLSFSLDVPDRVPRRSFDRGR